MKSKIWIYSLFLVVTACSGKEPEKSDNALQGDEVKVTYTQDLVSNSRPAEWYYGLNRELLIDLLFKQVLENNKPAYITDQFYFVDERMNKEQITDALAMFDTNNVMNQMKEMLFNEVWYAPENLQYFSKSVTSYCPVRVWTDKGGQTFKRMEFYAKPEENTKGVPVAQSVFTELDLQLQEGIIESSGLDMFKFKELVLNRVSEGKTTAYDPIYIVDKTLRPMKPEDIAERAELDLTTSWLIGEIRSLLFEENWYFDPETMNLKKEVLSLGLVRKHWQNGEEKTKILFFIKFK